MSGASVRPRPMPPSDVAPDLLRDDAEALALRADETETRALTAAGSERLVEAIKEAQRRRDTVGGVIEVVATGVPPGLGSHVQADRKLDGRLGGALLSIQAIKAVEIGDGIRGGRAYGSETHDPIVLEARPARPHQQPRGRARGRNHQRPAGGAAGGDEAHRHRPGRAALGAPGLARARPGARRAERHLRGARRGRGDRGGPVARPGRCAARGARRRHHGRPAARVRQAAARRPGPGPVTSGSSARWARGSPRPAAGWRCSSGCPSSTWMRRSSSAPESPSPSCSGPKASPGSGRSRPRPWARRRRDRRRSSPPGGGVVLGERRMAHDAEQRGRPGPHRPGQTLLARLGSEADRRPLLAGDAGAALERLLARRRHLYRRADLTLDTEGLGLDAVAGALVGLLRSLQGPLVRPGGRRMRVTVQSRAGQLLRRHRARACSRRSPRTSAAAGLSGRIARGDRLERAVRSGASGCSRRLAARRSRRGAAGDSRRAREARRSPGADALWTRLIESRLRPRGHGARARRGRGGGPGRIRRRHLPPRACGWCTRRPRCSRRSTRPSAARWPSTTGWGRTSSAPSIRRSGCCRTSRRSRTLPAAGALERPGRGGEDRAGARRRAVRRAGERPARARRRGRWTTRAGRAWWGAPRRSRPGWSRRTSSSGGPGCSSTSGTPWVTRSRRPRDTGRSRTARRWCWGCGPRSRSRARLGRLGAERGAAGARQCWSASRRLRRCPGRPGTRSAPRSAGTRRRARGRSATSSWRASATAAIEPALSEELLGFAIDRALEAL